MRPAGPDAVSDLLKWRPLMILNKTLLGPAYVESVVSCSPALIASQGGKRLPLEVWDMIIDFSSRCPENHRFSLVRPKLLQNGARGDELVCERYQRWSSFGIIQKHEHIEMYRFFLAHPDRLYHPTMDSVCPNPFSWPLSPKRLPSVFPTALLALKTKVLHVELTVPDIIRHLEDGYCNCCSGKHVVGSDFGAVAQHSWFQPLLDVPMALLLTAFVICPLCVGPEYARECIEVQESMPLSRDEYRSWLLDRLESLGFKRPRWEDVPNSIESYSGRRVRVTALDNLNIDI